MKYSRFEDLPIWQEARILSNDVYRITANNEFRDFSLRDQMRRSAVSVVSNISEGFERGSNKELIQFLYISKGSLGELRAQSYIGYDNRYMKVEDFSSLVKCCENLSQKISNFISYLKRSPITGSKHKEKNEN